MLTNKEKDLIEEIRRGNARAFTDLVESYKDLVFTLSLRLLGNREEAEEVSQDAFIKIYKSLATFKGDSKVSTWIYRIAYNTALDRIKKNKRAHDHVEIDQVRKMGLADMDDALDKMVQEEKRQLIDQCLAKLPAEDAGIITLFYFEEKNLLEMEKILNVSANTIKVKLFRARKKLAGIMETSLEREILESNG